MIYLTHYRSKDIMRNLWWKYVATLVSENNILRNSDADMKRLIIKNKRKLWLWFLLLVFLLLACRAAYITGSKAEQTRNNEVEEKQADSRIIPNEMEILC